MGSVDKYLPAASYLVSLTGIALATSVPGALGAGLSALTSLTKLHENRCGSGILNKGVEWIVRATSA